MKINAKQLAKLEAAGLSNIGAAVYEEKETVMPNVAIAEGDVEIVESQFGPQMVITLEDNTKRFVNLRRGTDAKKKAYNLVRFEVIEDRSGVTDAGKAWSLKAGQSKVFAV